MKGLTVAGDMAYLLLQLFLLFFSHALHLLVFFAVLHHHAQVTDLHSENLSLAELGVHILPGKYPTTAEVKASTPRLNWAHIQSDCLQVM